MTRNPDGPAAETRGLRLTLRSAANRFRSVVKLNLLNAWVVHGRHIRCPMSVWFWSPHRKVKLGDFVQFGSGCSVQCDITFGNGVLVGRQVAFVGRDDHRTDVIGKTIWDSGRGDHYETVIEDDVWIGYGAIIIAGVSIGRGSIIGAGAVVNRDVPRYSVVAGVPARVVAMRFTAQQIKAHERILGYAANENCSENADIVEPSADTSVKSSTPPEVLADRRALG